MAVAKPIQYTFRGKVFTVVDKYKRSSRDYIYVVTDGEDHSLLTESELRKRLKVGKK